MQTEPIIFVSLLIFHIVSGEQPIFEISNGKLLGQFNGNYYSFKGIPYAEPPVGENRFESPKPYLSKWDDVRDATKFEQTCLRLDPMIKFGENVIGGSEDCLYLNVYTPSVQNDEDKLLPVNFFIHGGAFMFGNGDLLEEKILMKHKNFVFVTFNYRLGPLGFLSTEDDQISGNMGLKDQRLALEWVKGNIKNFGGDPDHILMSGFSAGGACVEFQLLTAGIENLISAAVSFSGSALNRGSIKPNPLEDAKKLAKILECPNIKSTTAIKNCLKQKQGSDIVKAISQFYVFNAQPFRSFAPVIESKLVKDAMITEHPGDLIKMGVGGKVPYLSSHLSEDGGAYTAELLHVKKDGSTDLEYYNRNYKILLPIMLFYGETMVEQYQKDDYTNELYQKFKVAEGKVTLENFNKLTNIFTYEGMAKGNDESLRLHKEFSETPVYSYLYDNPAPFGFGNLMANRTDINFGCVHGDDVFLIYNFPLRDQYKFTEDEQRISDNFVKMLETFASTGIPKFGNIDFPANNKQSDSIQRLKISAKDVTVESIVSD